MSIKNLGKESLIYGTGHVLARLVTFLLLPIYTHVFTPEEYGVISLAYAFIGIALMVYRYGMDTALMKYSVQLSDDEKALLKMIETSSPVLLNDLKTQSGLSNKKWDKTIKGLTAKSIAEVNKTDDDLLVRLL